MNIPISHRFTPHTTVATLIEDQGRYLLVHEAPDGHMAVFNQPAGHLEANESLIEAALRETLEETAWEVAITDFLGIYRYEAPNGETYLRHAFAGTPVKYHANRTLDTGIIDAQWLSYEQIIAITDQLRSPLVLQLIDDYRRGVRYPLAIIREHG